MAVGAAVVAEMAVGQYRYCELRPPDGTGDRCYRVAIQTRFKALITYA